ncbi:SDR family NAD(P)-dependent oxidoreductase [Streptomyces sp. HNM0575]|nr:SDR family NAD(P)-dependent oxidoreductase [Streptomyces sp. HNM0575]
MLDEFAGVVAGLEFHSPRIPLVSMVSGERVEALGPEYWVEHVRVAVRFADTVQGLVAEGVSTVLELGPDAVLSGMGQQLLPPDGLFVPSLRAGRDEPVSLMTGLAQLVTRGVTLDWAELFHGARRVDLPTYPFQHQRYWLEGTYQETAVSAASPMESRFWELVESSEVDALGPADDTERDALEAALPVLSSWRRRQEEAAGVGDWQYRIGWEPVPEHDAVPYGAWLVLCREETEEVSGCVEALSAAGVEAELVVTGGESLAASVPERPYAGVLSLLHFGQMEIADAVLTFSATVRALGEAGVEAPMWTVTAGATEAGGSPAQAAVWGIGRVAALEHPDRWGGLLDLAGSPEWPRVVAALAGDEDQVALRPSGTYARRLLPAPEPGGTEWRPSGTVLVTGGTGALGARVARWLAAHGAAHLVLASRQGENAPGARELAADLPATVVACDAADADALAAVLAGIPAEHPLTAVVHCAGVLDDGLVGSVTQESLEAVLRAKTDAVANLHELTGELDAFVVFSSIAGSLGLPGQGAYAAANSAVDALVDGYRAAGERAVSVAWGPWAEAGMAAGDTGEHLRAQGIVPMAAERALRALSSAPGLDRAHTVVADLDWERFAPAAEGAPLYRVVRPEAERPASGTPDLGRRLAGLSADRATKVLTDLVREEAAVVLGHSSATKIPPDQAFRDLGFDSLTAVELRARLSRASGLNLPAAVAFDYPTPTALAAHLRGRLWTEQAEPSAVDELEALFGGGDGDDDARARVAARLEAMLSRWHETRAAGGEMAVEDLDSASDDEIFRVIDEDLGLQ